MFISKPSRITLTLVSYIAIVLTLASVSQANGFTPEKRDHVLLNRMIKKRLPLDIVERAPLDLSGITAGVAQRADSANPLLGGLAGAGAEPPTFDSTTTSSSAATTGAATGTTAATQSTGSVTATSATSVATDTAATSALTTSGTSTAATTDSTSSSTSTTASSTTSSSSSVAPSTTSTTPAATTTPAVEKTPDAATTAPPDTQEQSTAPRSTLTSTFTAPAESTTANDLSSQTSSGVSKTTKTTLIVVIVIAATIGGVILLWTIIRKTKFKPSSSFEDRMQPIDWQPTVAEDRDVPGLHRNASAASHGSFHSSGHEDIYGHGVGAASLQPIPDHDFTAGPSLAPGGGYADLARGPSPQPQMAYYNGGRY
ncbi:hypothetical protein C8Q75DRAFT_809606 [Abortiporus biennis]|nr:hypothetical protein C8Q75DRAFT_809606 [Abortiporus biennis]